MKVQTLSALTTEEPGKGGLADGPSVLAGTEMMDGQLMGEFEVEAKELEADSWSLGVEQQHLQHLDRELVKRQDVIYGRPGPEPSAAPPGRDLLLPSFTHPFQKY